MDFSKILNNDAFMLGAGILGNNSGHYGQFGPALNGGLAQYQNTKQNQYNRAMEEQSLKLKLEQFKQQQAKLAQEQAAYNKTMEFTGGDPLDVYKIKNPNITPTSDMQNYQFSKQNPEFAKYQQGVKNAGALKINMNQNGQARIVSPEEKAEMNLDPKQPYVWNDKGIPTPLKTTNYTEGQLAASGFADRMEQAEARMKGVMDLGFDPATLHQALGSSLSAGNYLLDDNGQMFKQAQEDWVRAKLRKESGAVIGPQEMVDEIKTYFPQPGDGEKVLEAKRQARAVASRGMVTMAGGNYKSTGIYDEQSNSTGLSVGAVDSGYVFKGGNPADPKNWEPVK
jgi:hypothetical protein